MREVHTGGLNSAYPLRSRREYSPAILHLCSAVVSRGNPDVI